MKIANDFDAWGTDIPYGVAIVVSWDSILNRPNAILLESYMRVSYNPPLIAISIAQNRHSHKLISKEQEFVLSLPSENMRSASIIFGNESGSNIDKFKTTNIKIIPSDIIKPPILEDACANFECKVINSSTPGDHTIFIGKIIESYISEIERPRLFWDKV